MRTGMERVASAPRRAWSTSSPVSFGIRTSRRIRSGASARWSIRDNGIGVPDHSQGRLFEKFHRAENALAIETEGTGLGLYLVRLIMEQFGGRVWCESAEGCGATFTLTMPLGSEIDGTH